MLECIGTARKWLEDGENVVVATVADVSGSAPREVGTKMIVSRLREFDTIGGGRLEYEVMSRAHEMLLQTDPCEAKLFRFALGPALGQCCGGSVGIVCQQLNMLTRS